MIGVVLAAQHPYPRPCHLIVEPHLVMPCLDRPTSYCLDKHSIRRVSKHTAHTNDWKADRHVYAPATGTPPIPPRSSIVVLQT